MAETYRTVGTGGTGEYEEKKSRFIATLRHTETPEEAAAFIEEMRKTYWDARHNCSAYILGRNGEYRHSSDDGEPSGTAGRPMLDVLAGEGVTDTAVVVTRYFGGTLLGTGGLVRAYSEAVREGLKHSEILEKQQRIRIRITTDYNGVGKLQYLFGQKQIPVLHAEYGEAVILEAAVLPEEKDAVAAAVADATGGRAAAEELGWEWI